MNFGPFNFANSCLGLSKRFRVRKCSETLRMVVLTYQADFKRIFHLSHLTRSLFSADRTPRGSTSLISKKGCNDVHLSVFACSNMPKILVRDHPHQKQRYRTASVSRTFIKTEKSLSQNLSLLNAEPLMRVITTIAKPAAAPNAFIDGSPRSKVAFAVRAGAST
jgi:hypothetical protein